MKFAIKMKHIIGDNFNFRTEGFFGFFLLYGDMFYIIVFLE